MKKLLTFLLFFAPALFPQTNSIVFTPAQPPQAATPAKLVVTAGNVICTLTGNAVPASSVSIACSVGTITIPPYSTPVTTGSTYTFSYSFGTNILTVALSYSNNSITFNATANGVTPATTGSF